MEPEDARKFLNEDLEVSPFAFKEGGGRNQFDQTT